VATELPSLVRRPVVWSAVGATRRLVVDAGVARRLREVARGQRASLFMVLLAGFVLAVSQLTGECEVVVGTPVAGRDRVQTREVMGFFVNTVPLRVCWEPGAGFAQVVARVRECCLQAYAHAEVPFDQIVEAVNPPRDLSRNPLFQLMFSVQEQNPMAVDADDPNAATWSDLDIPAVTTKFDATVTVVDGPAELRIEVIGATAVLAEDDIESLVNAYGAVLGEAGSA